MISFTKDDYELLIGGLDASLLFIQSKEELKGTIDKMYNMVEAVDPAMAARMREKNAKDMAVKKDELSRLKESIAILKGKLLQNKREFTT